MELVNIRELSQGDTILIEGLQDHEVMIVEVDEVTEDNLIIPKGLGGTDYAPEDPENIVLLSYGDQEPIINPVSNKLHLKLTNKWHEQLGIAW